MHRKPNTDTTRNLSNSYADLIVARVRYEQKEQRLRRIGAVALVGLLVVIAGMLLGWWV